jgi:hypothetical protein
MSRSLIVESLSVDDQQLPIDSYCFCPKCVPPPSPRFKQSSPLGTSLEELEDVSSLHLWKPELGGHRVRAPMPRDRIARLLTLVARLIVVFVRSGTLIAIFVLLAQPSFPSWVTSLALVEVFLAFAIMRPYKAWRAKLAAEATPPRLSRAYRWHVFTETIRAIHPPRLSGSQRRGILRSSRPVAMGPHLSHVTTHVGTFLAGWFCGAAPCAIRNENLKEWLAWAFFHVSPTDLASPQIREIDAMVQYLNKNTGLNLLPGYNPEVRCMRLTLDPPRVVWRLSLLYAVSICACFIFWLLEVT